MALSLDSYANYLEKENTQMKQRHSLPHPVRQVGDHVTASIFLMIITSLLKRNMIFLILFYPICKSMNLCTLMKKYT